MPVGRRETVVTKTQTALDFARILKYTFDVLYPRIEKIILVTDNLNIHTTVSTYKTFKLEKAHRLSERFKWHYALKHGIQLDMAEIEIGVMSRQALSKPLADIDSFKEQVCIWTIKRKSEYRKINGQFTT